MVILPGNSFSKKKSSVKSRKSVEKASVLPNKKKNYTEIIPAPETEESSLTCEEKYNICMDNVCFNSSRIRTDCDTSIDSFETVIKDGKKFRVGNDLYTFAKGVCSSTLKSCDLKERNHIETVYKAKIKEDTLTKNYLDAINAGSDETLNAVLEEYKECMAPLCGNNFTECFTIKDVERRSANCSNVLSKTSKPLSVKGMFYNKMEESRSEFCKNSGGNVDYTTKLCNVDVTYGSLEKMKDKDGNFYYTGKMSKAVAKKTFKMGEIVECTQEYFNTTNTYKPDLARGILSIAKGVVKSVAGVVFIAGGLAGAAFTGGATTAAVIGGASFLCHGAADIVNGAIKVNTDVKVDSGCFINNELVSYMGQYFKINFKN